MCLTLLVLTSQKETKGAKDNPRLGLTGLNVSNLISLDPPEGDPGAEDNPRLGLTGVNVPHLISLDQPERVPGSEDNRAHRTKCVSPYQS
jgi:hypothetical protein